MCRRRAFTFSAIFVIERPSVASGHARPGACRKCLIRMLRSRCTIAPSYWNVLQNSRERLTLWELELHAHGSRSFSFRIDEQLSSDVIIRPKVDDCLFLVLGRPRNLRNGG